MTTPPLRPRAGEKDWKTWSSGRSRPAACWTTPGPTPSGPRLDLGVSGLVEVRNFNNLNLKSVKTKLGIACLKGAFRNLKFWNWLWGLLTWTPERGTLDLMFVVGIVVFEFGNWKFGIRHVRCSKQKTTKQNHNTTTKDPGRHSSFQSPLCCLPWSLITAGLSTLHIRNSSRGSWKAVWATWLNHGQGQLQTFIRTTRNKTGQLKTIVATVLGTGS